MYLIDLLTTKKSSSDDIGLTYGFRRVAER